MTKEGLRIESASSVIARDMIRQHVGTFSHVIREDRAANTSTVAAYIDGLAAVTALTIAGGFGGRDDIVTAVVGRLTECVDRDLKHLTT